MVKIYDTEKLNKSYNDVMIVDVRSRFEFETLHINNALNIPVINNRLFIKQLKSVKSDGIPVVFYCNGHRCYHSYKAVIKARKAGIRNVFSYDSGIFDWTKKFPDKATLMGKTPVIPDQLISKTKLKEHLLDPVKFVAEIDDKTVILDIREPAQRGFLELFPYRQENLALSQKDKLIRFISSISKSNKELLVYDEGGTQVRWLQYYLEANGATHYFFMKGGAKKYFKEILK